MCEVGAEHLHECREIAACAPANFEEKGAHVLQPMNALAISEQTGYECGRSKSVAADDVVALQCVLHTYG